MLFGGSLLIGAGGVFGAFLVIIGVVFAAALFAAQVLITLMLALLVVAGPPLIAVSPIPELSHLARSWAHALLAVALVPVGWTVLFATAGALALDATSFTGGAGGLPEHVAAAFAALITFVLAIRLPLVLFGHARHLMFAGSAAGAGERSLPGVERVRAARSRLRSVAFAAPALGSTVGAAAGALGAPKGGPLGSVRRRLTNRSSRQRTGVPAAGPLTPRSFRERVAMAGAKLREGPRQARAAMREDRRYPSQREHTQPAGAPREVRFAPRGSARRDAGRSSSTRATRHRISHTGIPGPVVAAQSLRVPGERKIKARRPAARQGSAPRVDGSTPPPAPVPPRRDVPGAVATGRVGKRRKPRPGEPLMVHRSFRSLDQPPKLLGFTIGQWAGLIAATVLLGGSVYLLGLPGKAAITLLVLLLGVPAALLYVSEAGGPAIGRVLADLLRWRATPRYLPRRGRPASRRQARLGERLPGVERIDSDGLLVRRDGTLVRYLAVSPVNPLVMAAAEAERISRELAQVAARLEHHQSLQLYASANRVEQTQLLASEARGCERAADRLDGQPLAAAVRGLGELTADSLTRICELERPLWHRFLVICPWQPPPGMWRRAN